MRAAKAAQDEPARAALGIEVEAGIRQLEQESRYTNQQFEKAESSRTGTAFVEVPERQKAASSEPKYGEV